MEKYIFFNLKGECCEKEAHPSRPETLPFPREEIKHVFLNCTGLFLTPYTPSPKWRGGWGVRSELENLQKLLDYIADRYKEKLTFDFALSMMGMSKSRFCVFFRNQTGMTYIAYINKVRIGKAVPLLLETNLTVEAIGFDCGFDSPPNFYKCFKKHFGMSPARFRMWKGQQRATHRNDSLCKRKSNSIRNIFLRCKRLSGNPWNERLYIR